jgi:hypothetical protein
MDTKNPRTGQSARVSKSTAADSRNLTSNPVHPQPRTRKFRVIIARDLWQRCVVSVEPATITFQLRSFPNHGTAIAHSEGLAHLEGWPLINRAGGVE